MKLQTDFVIQQGKTFSKTLRWGAKPIIYKAITNVQKSAPVRLTVVGHTVPDGWSAAVTSILGMTELNAKNTPPKPKDYHKVTVIDVDTIEFNDINAAEFSTFKSGGYIQYNTPVDMDGMTARMSIKDKIGGTELESLTTENGGIVIDNTAKTIKLNISATDTAAYEWITGVYDLELISGIVVTQLLSGAICVKKEVTT